MALSNSLTLLRVSPAAYFFRRPAASIKRHKHGLVTASLKDFRSGRSGNKGLWGDMEAFELKTISVPCLLVQG